MLLLLLACGDDPPADDSKPPHPRPEDSTSAEESTPPDDSAAETGDDTGDLPAPTPIVRFEGAPPRNLLVISVDTFRRDQVGWVSGLDTTPFLDSLLAESVVLADHRTCSNWTAPSMLCSTLGYLPVEDGWWPTSVYDGYGHDPRVPTIPTELPTLARLLNDQGFATTLVSANGVYSPNNGDGIVSGFETIGAVYWYPAGSVVPTATWYADATAASGRPWYTHVHFTDPHSPYYYWDGYSYEVDALEAKYDRRWNVRDSGQVYALMGQFAGLSEEEQAVARDFLFAIYRGEIRYWDANLEIFWNDLDARGLLDDTLVAFWFDHGEQFGEHGDFMHGLTLFAEENRGFAAFWAKNIVPAVWTGLTVHQDLPPTILDALGLPPAEEHTGVVAGTAPDDRSVYTFNYLVGYSEPLYGITKGDRQMLYHFDGDRYAYDLAADPEGTVNIYDPADPEIIALWDELLPKVQRIRGEWGLIPTDPGP